MPFPLLLMVRMDHSPETRFAFSIGLQGQPCQLRRPRLDLRGSKKITRHVESSGVSAGVRLVFVQRYSSPDGLTKTLFATSALQPEIFNHDEHDVLETRWRCDLVPSYSDTKVKSSVEREF